MRSLLELQVQFARGVLFEDAAVVSAIAPHGVDPNRRLRIYRNNAREGFLKALEATFPVILRLAGLDWFRQTGVQYMRALPSTSGNLHYIGRQFPAFLDERLRDSAYAYFGDVARLEWAYQEVLVAADHPTFDPSALSAVAPASHGALRFETHPAVRLVTSPFPLLAIWQANQDGASESTIDLAAGASHVLVIRREDHVELREISSGEFTLLDAFTRGKSLEEAADAVVAAEESVDLGTALARLMQLGTLVDFSLDPESDRDDTLHSSSGA
jgi:hypothetical protein